jgi:hypothetical protein
MDIVLIRKQFANGIKISQLYETKITIHIFIIDIVAN